MINSETENMMAWTLQPNHGDDHPLKHDHIVHVIDWIFDTSKNGQEYHEKNKHFHNEVNNYIVRSNWDVIVVTNTVTMRTNKA